MFIAGLYLLAVVFYAVSSAPVPEAVPHRTEFYERMGQEAIPVLTAALDTQDIIRVKALNGHEIPFAAGTSKEKMESFLRQYNEALQKQASKSVCGSSVGLSCGGYCPWRSFTHWARLSAGSTKASSRREHVLLIGIYCGLIAGETA